MKMKDSLLFYKSLNIGSLSIALDSIQHWWLSKLNGNVYFLKQYYYVYFHFQKAYF